VIENYDTLKQRLIASGHKFLSDTDTEVLAHVIGEHYERLKNGHTNSNGSSQHKLAQAVTSALTEVTGRLWHRRDLFQISLMSSLGRVVARRSSSVLVKGKIF